MHESRETEWHKTDQAKSPGVKQNGVLGTRAISDNRTCWRLTAGRVQTESSDPEPRPKVTVSIGIHRNRPASANPPKPLHFQKHSKEVRSPPITHLAFNDKLQRKLSCNYETGPTQSGVRTNSASGVMTWTSTLRHSSINHGQRQDLSSSERK